MKLRADTVPNTCQQEDCNRLHKPDSDFPLCGKHRVDYRAGDIRRCIQCRRYVNSVGHICEQHTTQNKQSSPGNIEDSPKTTKPCKIEGCTGVYNSLSRRYFSLCNKHLTELRMRIIKWCTECEEYVTRTHHSCKEGVVQHEQVSPSENTRSSSERDYTDTNESRQSSVLYDICQEERCNNLYKSDSDFPFCEEHISDRYWTGEIWRCIECDQYVNSISHNCESRVAQNNQAESWEDTMVTCELKGCASMINHFSGTAPAFCTMHLPDFQEGNIRQCERCQKYSYTDFTSCVQCSAFVPERSPKWIKSDANAAEFYVYFLQLNNGGYYPGQTNNLARRIQQHQNGESKATADKDPQLVWYNTVDTREQAVNLELQMKNMRDHEITQMITKFNLAIKGNLPNLVTKGDMNNLEQIISENDLQHRKSTDKAISKMITWVIITGIILAGLIIAFEFWI